MYVVESHLNHCIMSIFIMSEQQTVPLSQPCFSLAYRSRRSGRFIQVFFEGKYCAISVDLHYVIFLN